MSNVTLPIALPLSFSGIVAGDITLPIVLPVTFGNNIVERSTVKMATKVTCYYANLPERIQLKTKEIANTPVIKIPVKEVIWDFYGIIIEENVIALMSQNLTLIEDVRSRILLNADLINRNRVKIGWYGDKVPLVEVYRKIAMDENYTKIGTYKWEDGSVEINLDNNEYDIKLLGSNSTGESGIMSLGEVEHLDVFTNVKVSINEKIYSFDVDLVGQYEIKVEL